MLDSFQCWLLAIILNLNSIEKSNLAKTVAICYYLYPFKNTCHFLSLFRLFSTHLWHWKSVHKLNLMFDDEYSQPFPYLTPQVINKKCFLVGHVCFSIFYISVSFARRRKSNRLATRRKERIILDWLGSFSKSIFKSHARLNEKSPTRNCPVDVYVGSISISR